MNNLNKAAISIVVSLSLIGCVTNESMDDQTQTKVEGTAIGALLGAALGAAIGGSDGALIGAAVGAGSGYLIGNEVAQRKAKYASNEDFLDGEINNIAEYNKTARSYNKSLTKEIKSLNTQVASLEKKYKQGKIDKSKLEAKKKTVEKHMASNSQMLDDLEKEYKVNVSILDERKQTNGAADPYVKKLKKEITALKNNIKALQQNSTQLAAIDERLSV